MRKQRVFGKVLSSIFVLFQLWSLGPILLELVVKSKSADDLGLLVLLTLLIVTGLFSLALWLPTDRLNNSTLVKWVTILLFILVSVAVFLFVYSSWVLLVIFLAVDYAWFKRLIQGKMNTWLNLTLLTIISFLLSIYVLIQLIP